MTTRTRQPNPPTALQDEAEPQSRARRPFLLLASAAGMCWASALAMLFTANLSPALPLFAPQRTIFYLLVLLAALLTFVPIQRHLRLPGLAFEGVVGTWLLCYTLAFLPPPTDSLLSLPDTPVYLIFIAALFWSVSASALPAVYALGRRIFHQRARRYDSRRARRQAHQLGALAALTVGMAALRVLTPIAFVLLLLILVVTEMLCLAYIEAAT